MHTNIAKLLSLSILIFLTSCRGEDPFTVEAVKELFGTTETKKVTFNNVCDNTELDASFIFLNRSLYLYFDKNARSSVMEGYEEYKNALEKQMELIRKYYDELQVQIKETADIYHDKQLDYFKYKFKNGLKKIYQITSDDKEINYDLPENYKISDHFDAIKDEIDESDINDAYYVDLKTYIASVGIIDPSEDGLKKLKSHVEYLVCNDLIDTLINTFDQYYNDNISKSQPSSSLFVEFFQVFINYDYKGYKCFYKGGQIEAGKYIAYRFYTNIFEKDLLPFNPMNLDKFIDEINDIPYLNDKDYKVSDILGHDKNFIQFINKFRESTLDGLKDIKSNIQPISIPFIQFLNDYDNEYKKINLKFEADQDEIDIPKEIFKTIYKVYVAERYADRDKYLTNNEFDYVAKQLYLYIKDTDDFDKHDDLTDKDLINKQNFIDIHAFKKYRIPMLIILGGKINDTEKDFTITNNNNIDKLLVTSGFNSELISSDTIENYFGKEILDKHIDNTSNIILQQIKRRPKKQKAYNQIYGGAPNEIKLMEEELLDKPSEDTNIDNSNDQKIFNEYLDVDNKKNESVSTFNTKLEKLANQVLENSDPIEKLQLIPLMNKGIVEKLTNYRKLINEEDKSKEIKTDTLINVNKHYLKEKLITIETPELYNFFMHLSQSNMDTANNVLGNTESKLYKHKQRIFTLDKVLFLHKWHSIMKNKINNEEDIEKRKANRYFIEMFNKDSKSLDMYQKNLSINYNNKLYEGYRKVYGKLVSTQLINSYIKGFHLMTGLIELFKRFYNLSNTEMISNKKNNEKLLLLYKIILNIRADSFDEIVDNHYEYLLTKIQHIRNIILYEHLNNKENTVANKYSVGYREIADILFYSYYFLQNENQASTVLTKQIELNFGIDQLSNYYKDKYPNVHNPFNFGGNAFQSQSLMYYSFMKGNDFLKDICLNEKLKNANFCVQYLIFSRTANFIRQNAINNFDKWVDDVYDDDMKNIAASNKSITFSALELINNLQYRFNKVNVSTLVNINDTEENKFRKELDNEGGDLSKVFESNFKKFIILSPSDKEWLTNYMFVKFEAPHDNNREHIYQAFESIVNSSDLEDLLSYAVEFEFQDDKLSVKAESLNLLKLMLKYTRSYENLSKIAEYLISKNRAHILIYLDQKTYDDNQTSNEINSIKSNVNVKSKIIEIFNSVKETAKSMYSSEIQNYISERSIDLSTSSINDDSVYIDEDDYQDQNISTDNILAELNDIKHSDNPLTNIIGEKIKKEIPQLKKESKIKQIGTKKTSENFKHNIDVSIDNLLSDNENENQSENFKKINKDNIKINLKHNKKNNAGDNIRKLLV